MMSMITFVGSMSGKVGSMITNLGSMIKRGRKHKKAPRLRSFLFFASVVYCIC